MMPNEQIIKQLEALIDDREAFCISDPEHDEIYIKDIDALKAAIEFLKNGEPVKHGKWIEKPTISYCSCCHVHWTKSFIISLRKTYKYCPNCGARMDGDTK